MALILVRKLGTRKDKKGRNESWAEYLCFNFGCCKIVEMRLNNGKVCQSCGCKRKELISKGNKGKKRTEEHKKNYSEAFKGLQVGDKHPNFGKKSSEETKRKMRETHIKNGLNKGEKNPNYGKFKELAPNWQGGKSFEIYPQEFKQIRKDILKRDNYTCQDPKCEHKTNNLDIHHIDYNKQNNNPENLTTLCDNCHTKTNGKNNRQYWAEFYQNIMINKLVETEGMTLLNKGRSFVTKENI